MTQAAAIYCRSSKDRAEVGLAAQRAELKVFAKSKGLAVAAEYSDMEVSGSLDETSRPGLKKLLAALKDPAREWQTILALDTSRVARDPMLALYVTREAEKAGVAIQYAKMPVDSSSAFGETMLSVVRAFDRLHARLSAEKGRGGLAANLAEGFRAGGAAPIGYKLAHKETGATRGGAPVRKSKLAVDPSTAPKIKRFLEGRADGVSRTEAAKRAKLEGKAVASLIGIERNALTYAGFTVWNQRQKVKPTREDPRKTMAWRPRAEWTISEEPTHPALITRDQAERVLAAVDVANPKPEAPRVREPGKFILSGVLFTPDGQQWHGDSHDNAYRAGAKGQRVNASWLEGEIITRLAADFADRGFLSRTIREARRMADGIEADPVAIDGDIRRAEGRLENLVNLAADSGDKALLAKIRETEAALSTLREQKAAWTERKALKQRLLGLKEEDLPHILAASGLKLRGEDPAAVDDLLIDILGIDPEKHDLRRDELRGVLTTLVKRIELDPKTREYRIHYRLPVTGVKRASPRGCDANSGIALLVDSSGRLGARAPRTLQERHDLPAPRNVRERRAPGGATLASPAAVACSARSRGEPDLAFTLACDDVENIGAGFGDAGQVLGVRTALTALESDLRLSANAAGSSHVFLREPEPLALKPQPAPDCACTHAGTSSLLFVAKRVHYPAGSCSSHYWKGESHAEEQTGRRQAARRASNHLRGV